MSPKDRIYSQNNISNYNLPHCCSFSFSHKTCNDIKDDIDGSWYYDCCVDAGDKERDQVSDERKGDGPCDCEWGFLDLVRHAQQCLDYLLDELGLFLVGDYWGHFELIRFLLLHKLCRLKIRL